MRHVYTPPYPNRDGSLSSLSSLYLLLTLVVGARLGVAPSDGAPKPPVTATQCRFEHFKLLLFSRYQSAALRPLVPLTLPVTRTRMTPSRRQTPAALTPNLPRPLAVVPKLSRATAFMLTTTQVLSPSKSWCASVGPCQCIWNSRRVKFQVVAMIA
jgi:hypothetical protein